MGSYLDVESIIAMLPKPGGASSATPVPPTSPPPTQPPFAPSPQPVNIQLTVAKDDQGRDRYDRDGRPVYIQTPVYGAGYYPPGLPYLPGGVPGVGGIGSYPGIAGDASVRIGSINSSVTQGNMNWAGEQALGGAVATQMPTSAPLPPPPALMPETSIPVVLETPFPGEVSNGTNWSAILFGVCILVAVAVAGWLLYSRFYKKKKNSNNRGNTAANGGRRNNNAARLDANEFGDFGDLETPGTGAAR